MIKKQFLIKAQVASEAEAITESIKAALARSCTYTKSATDSDGARLRRTVADQLRGFAPEYAVAVGVDQHSANIIRLCEAVSQAHGPILREGRFRIGIAQKALNLYLKFLWCLDRSRPTPPHCPIDRIVLTDAGIDESWTKLDSIEIYSQWASSISDIARRSGFETLQDWELALWNKRA
jgi:hypothetical protein